MKKYLNGIQHVGIPTQNFNKTLEFYKSLGFEIAYQTVNNDDDVAFLRSGNLTIETYTAKDANAFSGSIDHIAIDVNDIEGAHKAATSLGLDMLDNGEIFFLNFWDNGIKYFKIKGPNQEIIEFSQML